MYPVSLRNVGKTYRLDTVTVPALSAVSIDIRPGRFTVLCGPSGSGKTTLLNMMGCIDRPDAGEIQVDGQAVQAMTDDALSDFRARRIGFVFQNFNLLPVLTAFENVEYPLVLAAVPAAQRKARVRALLDAVGLADRAGNRPGQLSGGQRQRVAIARALATEPALVLADEPTANLDSQTGAEIIALMRRLQRERGASFVFSSHDPMVLAQADDVVRIRTGIGKAVLVQLAADERFVGDSTGLATGNSAAWKVSVQGSNIFFKPAMSSPRTNMVLATNKRTYVFDLALAGKGQAQTYVLRFRYPEDIRKQQLADEAKRRTAGTMKELYPDTTHGFRNYDFWAFGEKSLAPTAMWDDGRFTYLRFNNARDMPAVFKVSPDGTESTVNSHVDMDTLVVHDTSA